MTGTLVGESRIIRGVTGTILEASGITLGRTGSNWNRAEGNWDHTGNDWALGSTEEWEDNSHPSPTNTPHSPGSPPAPALVVLDLQHLQVGGGCAGRTR